jgi:menaquinone-9 beta-reductase
MTMTLNGTRDSAYDVVVIGARCAGAATALLLARRGFRVLAVDKSRHGSDTLSTHALMRGGVLQLVRWGLLDAVRAAGTPSVSTTTFHYGEVPVEVVIKPRDGIDALYAPRRTVLDPILADAAAEAGAEILRGPRLVDLIRTSEGRVEGVVVEDRPGDYQRIPAGLVIGADGVRSSVARLVNAPLTREGRRATGVVYGYWEGLDRGGYHWHFRPGVSAGAIATNGGTLVFAGVSRDRFWNEIRLDLAAGFRRVLGETAPELAEAVADSKPLGGLRGYPGYAGYFRRCWGPGWALVGDAGYFKDPITAHGITDALRDAELLARAVSEGTAAAMAGYQEARDELSRRLFEITDDVASLDWDFDRLQHLHREMSDEMRREVEYLAGLREGPTSTAVPPPKSRLARVS